MFELRVVDRLRRVSALLSALAMLYARRSAEWIRKSVFHCVELSARTLATNVHQRVWNLVYEDEDTDSERKLSNVSDEQHLLIIDSVKPLLAKALRLGFGVLDPKSDEFVCLQKIEQCVPIVDFILDEFEHLKRLLQAVRDPRRDLTFDRRPLQAAKDVVRKIWATFEEVRAPAVRSFAELLRVLAGERQLRLHEERVPPDGGPRRPDARCDPAFGRVLSVINTWLIVSLSIWAFSRLFTL